jgi:chromosome segregation ATPase
MTKAEEVFTKVEELVAGGKTKADAFKQLAEHYSQPVDSLRGSYYTWKSHLDGGGTRRPRRRETTPEDALADARMALERAIESVDREVAEAKTRSDEAKAEHDALKASALERKKAIQEKLDVLK